MTSWPSRPPPCASSPAPSLSSPFTRGRTTPPTTLTRILVTGGSTGSPLSSSLLAGSSYSSVFSVASCAGTAAVSAILFVVNIARKTLILDYFFKLLLLTFHKNKIIRYA